MSGFKPSCRIRPNALGDWQILPPAGQITQIGDAGATASGLVANDDLFVSGSMEVRDQLYVHAESAFYHTMWISSNANVSFAGANGEELLCGRNSEEITIPVGQGAAGVDSIANLCPANSIILACVGRVTQAPGGGATLFDAGRNPVGPAEFADNHGVALDTTFVSPTDGDGSNDGPFYNPTDKKVKITTLGDVTGTDMKVRITVFYMRLYPPET